MDRKGTKVARSKYRHTGFHIDKVIFADDLARNWVFRVVVPTKKSATQTNSDESHTISTLLLRSLRLYCARSLQVLQNELLLVDVARFDRDDWMQRRCPRDCRTNMSSTSQYA